jgi:hypothetical protein
MTDEDQQSTEAEDKENVDGLIGLANFYRQIRENRRTLDMS